MATDAVRHAITGQDNSILFQDDAGNAYRIEPDGDSYRVTKNGTLIGLPKVTVVAKTANYTLTEADSGKVFTNVGASGSVTFTLPAVATSAGLHYKFISAVLAQNMVIAAPANTMVAGNDIAATSITFSTASEIAGNGVEVFCDGTLWYAFLSLGNEAFTPTIA